jgi:hypothetical protein
VPVKSKNPLWDKGWKEKCKNMKKSVVRLKSIA